MILTRSPHYITVPFVSPSLGFTCARFKLELFIWKGLKNNVPDDPDYSITINNPTESTGDKKINISKLINEAIEFEPIGNPNDYLLSDLIDSPNQVWVKTQVFYSESLTGAFYSNPENEDTQLALLGYGYGNSGENPDTNGNMVLMRVGEYSCDRNGVFIVPIELEETVPPSPSITITAVTEDATPDYDVAFTAVGTYADFYAVIEPTGEDAYVELFDGITSPESITLNFIVETDITMYGYDSLSNTNVVSNTFNFTPV